MDKKIANRILQETEHGYNLISDKFSQTRKNFWNNLEFIRNYAKEGDSILDFGCGNGRLHGFLTDKVDIEYVGVDVSAILIEKAKELNPGTNFKKIDSSQTSLPFQNEFFNAVYSIAVFHHIPSGEKRQKLAKELFRVIKKDGFVIITVWNLWPSCESLWQGKQKKYFINIFKNWKKKLLGKSELDWNDCYISFTDNEGRVFQRFHRAFTRRSLKKLFEKAGFKTERCELVGRNIVYIGKK